MTIESDPHVRAVEATVFASDQPMTVEQIRGYVGDDVEAIRGELHSLFAQGKPEIERSRRHAWFLERLRAVDTSVQADAAAVRSAYQGA